MGIFTRFRDIVSANINSMLDRAEDPEKLIRLMIREMEDTLVELKAACAGVIAEHKKLGRQQEEARRRETRWDGRVDLAVSRGRDDLAREALVEKRRYTELAASLDRQMDEHGEIIDRYRDDIRTLEEKLATAREKQRGLAQRHARAVKSRRAREEVRRADSVETISRFDKLEQRIDRMEAEADLVDYGRSAGLEEKFDELLADDDIEQELAARKATKARPAESQER